GDGFFVSVLEGGAGLGLSETASFCDAGSVDGHVAIEAGKDDAEKRDVAAGNVAADEGDQAAEDEHVDEPLHVFTVINGAEAGDETESCGEAWIGVGLRASGSTVERDRAGTSSHSGASD